VRQEGGADLSLWHWLWLGASMLLVGVLVNAYRRRANENSRLRAEAEQVTRLIETMDCQDWQGSLHGLLAAVSSNGLGRSAALLADLPPPDAATALDQGETAALRTGTLYLPLVEGAEPIGILAIEGPAQGARGLPGAHPSQGSHPLRVVQALCRLALGSMRLYHKHVALSSTDGLTGLSNHRHFQQALGVMVAQSCLDGEGLAVILLDIDHFKSVNDTHGHLFGDLVLREIGYLLRRNLPKNGLAARYGGEEMVILLKGAEAERAPEFAEQIRAAIADHEILDYTAGSRLQVTVSLGVACYELGQGKSRLVARADEALYLSKREGRNRVSVG